MSGGVDSSVSALLLKEQGFAVEGLFMKNWDEDDGTEYCTAKTDLIDAQAVCEKMGIKLHTANFASEYWDNVFENFLSEYKAGRTPNPDVLCNKEIKFKVFLQYAEMLGADFIATGHYARKRVVNGETQLLKGMDNNKDQSYFLCAVGEKEIAKSLFPVGELDKPEVRKMAEKHGLITYNKKDSTGICFIGERRFKDFLQKYVPAQPGNIQTLDGAVIGRHHGLMYHTLGQRQGLGIGGVKGANDEPWYVVEKNMARNVLIVTQGDEHPSLYSNTLEASQLNWISGKAPLYKEMQLLAKTRYRQPDQVCLVTIENHGGCRVKFTQPQRSVTPGQYVVFYDGEQCLGGAVIENTFNS